MITLTNSFHETEAHLDAAVGDTVSEEVVARVRNQLCRPSCSCSGADGTRNSQFGIVQLGNAWVVIQEEQKQGPDFVASGRRGGSIRSDRTKLKGPGSLPPAERSARGKAAAAARWAKKKAAAE